MMKFLKANLNKLLILLIYILVFFVLAELFVKIFENKVVDENSAILFTVINNIMIYLILIVSCCILLKKEIITDFKQLEKNNAVKIFVTCLAGVGLVYAGNLVGSILTTILGGEGSSANQETLEVVLLSKYGPIMLLMIVVIGPIVEELIFRKSMHEIFRYFKLPSWAVLLISSVLFGLIHVVSAKDFVQVFPYICMGLTLGWLEIKTKNIFPSIFVHIFNNGVAVAMIFFLDIFSDIIPM